MRSVLILVIISLLFADTALLAQRPDTTYSSQIRSVKLFRSGDPVSYPILVLNANEQLELHFDDMDGDVKFYYYSLQLCNADWRPANLPPFDYWRGFLSNRIGTYRISNLVQTRYTHYQVTFPERNAGPTRGGNYLLRVFLNDDTNRVVFSRRVLVVNKKVSVGGAILQAFRGDYFQSHQRIQATVNTQGANMQTFSPQDLKLTLLQNYNWLTARTLDRPTIFRSNYYEYADEELTRFPAGKEWRWIDLRSLRLRSERVNRIVDSDTSRRIDVYVTPDEDRQWQVYLFYRDLNGLFTTENRDNPNAWWQSEYAWVHFTYIPPGKRPLAGQRVFLQGEFCGYGAGPGQEMRFNDSLGVYTGSFYLKQGFYNYRYVAVPDPNRQGVAPSASPIEGDFWGTENQYMLLLYFRPFGARADELIGATELRSNFMR
ncbi:MAG: DUF5103 domain-containing protein [Bacteroidota bacterium]